VLTKGDEAFLVSLMPIFCFLSISDVLNILQTACVFCFPNQPHS